MLRSSLLVERLTSAIRRQNPRFGNLRPLWCHVSLQICLSGCQHSPQPPIADRRSTIAHCRTFTGSLLRLRSLQVSILPSTLPNITFKDTNMPPVAAVVVWKLISDAPSIGLSRATSIAKSTAASDSSFDVFALAFALRECSRGFALYLYPDTQGIVPKGMQKPGARGVSYRRRKAPVSQMTSIDVIRGAASFSMTSIEVIRGQRVNFIRKLVKNYKDDTTFPCMCVRSRNWW